MHVIIIVKTSIFRYFIAWTEWGGGTCTECDWTDSKIC